MGARIWPLLKNACLTENNISHSFIRVVSDQSTVLSLTCNKGHKAFLVFHADRVHLWGYPAVKVNLPEFLLRLSRRLRGGKKYELP